MYSCGSTRRFQKAVSVRTPACLPLSPSNRNAKQSVYKERHSRLQQPQHSINNKFEKYLPQSVATPEIATTSATSAETFNWYKHWWPVQKISDLHSDRPNKIQLLGEYFVVWKSTNGEWVAMKDICPHRLAPLSEGKFKRRGHRLSESVCVGRVEDDGTIMCSYHGWRFDTCGKCVKIPQADDEKSHQVACDSQRSAVTTYPSRVIAEVLWIWPDDSPAAIEDAASATFALPDDHMAAIERRAEVVDAITMMTELPYSFETLVENILDPAHLPVSHHGAFVHKRETACPLEMRLEEPLFPHSIASSFFVPSALPYPGRLEIVDPTCFCYQYGDFSAEGSGQRLFFFLSPVDDGRSRFLAFFLTPKDVFNEKHRARQLLLIKLFPWLFHTNFLSFLDSDSLFLRAQEMNLRKQGSVWTSSSYFTPASADLMVNTYRRWLATKGGGRPKMAINGEIAALKRRELLDRVGGHMAKCKVCQSAIRMVKRVIAVSEWICRCGLVAAAILMGTAYKANFALWKGALPLIPATVCALIAYVLKTKILPQFSFVDCVHQEKN